jgi:branched-chain amino acid transport system ATP-binding protein
MLEVKDLVAAYGRIEVIHNVSLDVKEAEIVALIGANGAGKSTLLNTIMSLVDTKSGQILFEEQEITSKTTREIVQLGIVQVPERRQLFGSMTVEENLMVGAYTRSGRDEKAAIREDLKRINEAFPILGQRKTQRAESLSGGEQQMLAIARAEMCRPRLWLMDEPTLGLAPLVVQQILDLISGIREKGHTVLRIEQNAVAALEVADRVYMMETGRISLSGPAKEIKDDPRVQEVFLGGGEGDEGIEQRIRTIAEKYRLESSPHNPNPDKH